MRLDGQYYGDLHDHWGGLADLQAGLVRVLHSLSFVDDPTRILRAVRFEQRFSYQIESRTLELLENALSLLDRVSGDRIRHEINHMLQEPAWEAMFERLSELGVLEAIHPALPWDQVTKERVRAGLNIEIPPLWANRPANQMEHSLQPASAYLSWLIVLDAGQAISAANRLRLPGWMSNQVQSAIAINNKQDEIVKMSPSAVVAEFDKHPDLSLVICHELSKDQDFREQISTYFEQWQSIQPETSGYDLRARGIPPGPHYKRVLDSLRAAWLDGKISTTKEESALLEELLDDLPVDE